MDWVSVRNRPTASLCPMPQPHDASAEFCAPVVRGLTLVVGHLKRKEVPHPTPHSSRRETSRTLFATGLPLPKSTRMHCLAAGLGPSRIGQPRRCLELAPEARERPKPKRRRASLFFVYGSLGPWSPSRNPRTRDRQSSSPSCRI